MTGYILDLFRRRKPKPTPRVDPPLFRQPIVPKALLKDDGEPLRLFTADEINSMVRVLVTNGCMDRSTDDQKHNPLKALCLKSASVIRQLNTTIETMENGK